MNVLTNVKITFEDVKSGKVVAKRSFKLHQLLGCKAGDTTLSELAEQVSLELSQ